MTSAATARAMSAAGIDVMVRDIGLLLLLDWCHCGTDRSIASRRALCPLLHVPYTRKCDRFLDGHGRTLIPPAAFRCPCFGYVWVSEPNLHGPGHEDVCACP